MWCYPNKVDFKRKLRGLYNNHGMYLSWAKKLRSHILENYTEEKVLKSMLETIVPSTVLNPPEYIYVSDLFSGQYMGGAEMSLQTIIEKTPSDRVGAVNSENLNESLLLNNKGAKWIFGNIANLKTEMFDLLKEHNIEYSFIEFDYKFCKHRNPVLYQMVEGEECNYLETEQGNRIKEFIENAQSVFYMSEQQKKLHLDLLGIENDGIHVLSSLFSEDFFNYVDQLREKTKRSNKSNKWVVLGSNSWVKGAQESEDWCKEEKLDYEVLWGLKPN